MRQLFLLLKNPEIFKKATLYSGAIFIFFGIGVAIIPNPIFLRMMPSNIFDYLFLASTSVLSGIYYALPEKKLCKTDKISFGGMILGFLAFGCPTCNKLLVLFLSYSFLFTVFDSLRPIIGVISIVTLLYAIHKKTD
jgi:hypothetical protein